MSEWRAIHTLPSDNIGRMLLWLPDTEGFHAAAWVGQLDGGQSIGQPEKWLLEAACLMDGGPVKCSRDLPTHWMPLPDGPM